MLVDSSSNSSLHPSLHDCSTSKSRIPTITALCISFLLLLPLFILVLYVGCQRRRKPRSTTAAGPVTSHSDVFTFNVVVLELIGILGLCLDCVGSYANQPNVVRAGYLMAPIITSAQSLFHILTCVERYLAVVHPVTYRGLKQAGGVRIRNVSIGCVWLLCCGAPVLSRISAHFAVAYTLLLLFLTIVVVSYCSFTTLRVLIRPGPGEVGGKRERVDQSKQRAFYTIVAVAGTLLLRFSGSLVAAIAHFSPDLSGSNSCAVMLTAGWLCLPSSLVLPLLFLHRAGKLPG